MKYISAQPDDSYFIWQLEVLDNNMRELGIINDSLVVIGFHKPEPSQVAWNYRNKNKNRVYFVEDERSDQECEYIPSIRPHILKKFFERKGYMMKDHDIFYHDSDILFRDLVKIKKMRNDTVYVSDTISYVGAEYIESKSKELLEKMCEVVGIDSKIVRKNEKNSGGAQYLFPPNMLTSRFWSKVEEDSVELYKLMKDTSEKYSPEHPIQAWTADMWAVLWNIWLEGFKSKVHKEMNFSWSTSPLKNWDECKIYHNAGVTSEHKDLFFKGKYIDETPFDADFSHVSKERCSIKYVEQIIKCKKYL